MADRSPTSILVVDDDEAKRYTIVRLLRGAGYEPIEAATGGEALRSAAVGTDLIILDVNLPDINGFEVCRRLKADPATASVPVLHLSATRVETEDRVQGLEGGADGYLSQSVEASELIATVRALLRVRRAEEAARALARQWIATFDAIRDGVCLLDHDGRIARCNQATERILASSSADLVGRYLPDLLPALSPLLKLDAPRRESLDLPLGDRWIHATIDPIRDDGNGPASGAVCILADVTERRTADRALRESEERFRLLVEGVKDFAIFSTAADGRIISWNDGAERILGYTEREILGRHFTCIFTPEDRAAGLPEQEMRTALAEGRAVDERWHVRKDGTRFWASGVVSPLRDEDGDLRGFAKVMRDVTERKRMEEELRRRAQELAEADRRKDEFLAMLAHELRNPLAPIRNTLEVIRLSDDPNAIEHARAMAQHQVGHMARLIDDLLDVSRITRGKIQLRKQPLDLATAVANAVAATRPQIEARGHRLELAIPPDPILVEWDPTRLEQVFANLLNNAAKYTETGGLIRLEAIPQGDEVVLRVRDSGIGIAPEMLPRVFDLFAQADRALVRSEGGLGIGLTLVRNLVERHGGSVSAHSAGLGQGSEFVVRLPTLAKTGSREAARSPRSSLPVSARRSILVVDDHRDAALTLARVLELWGHEVRVAHGGPEAIAAFAARPPDLVLLDIGLPGMDGYQVAARLRGLSGPVRPVLAALTGYGQDEDRRRSREAGFDHHLVKPVAPDELLALLGHA